MIKRNDVKQSSLSQFSGLKGKERYNSITNDPSILTARGKEEKNSDFQVSEWANHVRSMSACSRWESCPAMKCPLDPEIGSRMTYDPELDSEFKDSRCTMAKATRHRYWESLPEDLRDALPFQGYFEGEFKRIKAGRERWESMTDEQKDQARQRILKIRDGGASV